MSHPYFHSLSSARRLGGHWRDYYDIHSFFDETKAALADCRHRLFLHNEFGIELATRKWQKVENIRLIGNQHVSEDFGSKPDLVVDILDAFSWDGAGLQQPRKLELDFPVKRGLGGTPFDYAEIMSLFALPFVLTDGDDRAGMLVFHSYFPFICEDIIGPVFTRESDGKVMQTRFVAERIIIHAMHGKIPTLEQLVTNIPLKRWMCKALPLSEEFEGESSNGSDDAQ